MLEDSSIKSPLSMNLEKKKNFLKRNSRVELMYQSIYCTFVTEGNHRIVLPSLVFPRNMIIRYGGSWHFYNFLNYIHYSWYVSKAGASFQIFLGGGQEQADLNRYIYIKDVPIPLWRPIPIPIPIPDFFKGRYRYRYRYPILF